NASNSPFLQPVPAPASSGSKFRSVLRAQNPCPNWSETADPGSFRDSDAQNVATKQEDSDWTESCPRDLPSGWRSSFPRPNHREKAFCRSAFHTGSIQTRKCRNDDRPVCREFARAPCNQPCPKSLPIRFAAEWLRDLIAGYSSNPEASVWRARNQES